MKPENKRVSMFLALMPGFCHRYDKVMQRRDTILLLVLLLFSSCTQDDSFPVDSDLSLIHI